jgi:PAS domain S-box-containing protein
LLLILIATLIPALVAGLQFLERRDAEIAAARQALAATARQVAQNLEDTVRATAQLHYGLSRARDLDTQDRAACSAFLADVLKEHPQYTGILTIKPDGELFCDSLRTGRKLNLTDRRYFQDALNAGSPLAVEPAFGRLTGIAVLQVAYAARRETGEPKFVLLASLNLEKTMQSHSQALPRRNAVIALVDGKGTVLTWHPDGGKLRGTSIVDSPLFHFARDARGEKVREDIESGGVSRIWAASALPEFPAAGLHVLVGVSKQDLLAAANRNLGQALAILGVVSLLVFAGAWMLARRVMDRELAEGRRIRELNESLDQRVRERTAKLRESEERYHTLFNTLMEGFCIIEVLFDAEDRAIDYRFLEVNSAFEAQTGLRNAQGKLMRELAPEHEEHWFATYGKIALTGESIRFVDEAKALNRWYDVSAYRVGGPDSRKVAILFNDITEFKRAEQKVRGQLEHLNLLDHITRAIGERLDLKSIFQVVVRSLEDSLPIDFACICLHDPAANALTVTSVGVKSEALAHELTMDEQASIDVDENGLGRCVQGELVYEPDIGEASFPFPQRLARGGLRSLVMAPLRSESRVFGVLVAARRAAGAFGSVECEFLRQLSEHVALAARQAQLYGSLRQAYDDLRQTQQAAMQEERLRALGQMASGIAHDINNTLSPVSLYAESLLETEKNLSERARGYLETIQRAVDDVAETVARMREFYRQREVQLELAPVDVNQLVQQVLDLTRVRWSDMPQQHGVSIQVLTELASGLPKIMGVESEIREALVNLVFNAVDAMTEGGALTLRTRLHGGPEQAAVVIEVADEGVGMDEETRRRCLEPFFTTKGERGTGLGLAMVFGVAQRHSAELEIDSAPGAGTSMRLVFAVAAAAIAEPGQPAAAHEVPSRLRLLLVDDDPILLKSLRDALETDGHVIVAAKGGADGIAVFRASLERGERVDAVITDLGMPYVDGRQVAAAVKAASPATPVILLTGWGRRLVADGEIPPHVDRVLSKPPKLREVREALAQLCRRAAS